MGDTQMPEPGDLIEMDRGPYAHWAVYVGGGDVIHVTRLEQSGSSSGGSKSGKSNVAVVTKQNLKEALGTSTFRVNNFLDQEYKVRPVDEILGRANSLVGQQVPYHLLASNCEHFVTDLRYGKRKSRQVNSGLEKVAAGAAAAAISPAAAMGALGPVGVLITAVYSLIMWRIIKATKVFK
ncbi:retinoic acid receptor responder protein 3-like isoform X2 [Denticeps clupeoides]|uniref:LRAT domain-containing protein n=1 Tax=Denticeps clupeoides TaxID=299321 RepID=A0AAY4AZH6_9TELE|nr:retinoic acid receptor responder protein 3-like [Denticeps clupeoides]XP_028839919.1 retinoic acid receptor responder protein 3-like isoform X2 [Denticeps clupeoides]